MTLQQRKDLKPTPMIFLEYFSFEVFGSKGPKMRFFRYYQSQFMDIF